jgi:hypothetical protein
MWDGMVTFMITESMALKHTAQLHPEIPTISNANGTNRVYTMLDFEVGNYMALTGKYVQWTSMLKPVEPVYTTRSLLLPFIAVPFYFLANLLSLNPVSLIGLSVNSTIIALTALVIFCFSLDLYGSKRIAFILGLIFTGCSFILPYNTSLFPQPLQALCIFSGVFFLYKARHNHPSFICNFTSNKDTKNEIGYFYSGLAALFFGLSLFASPISGLFVPAFIICSLIYLRQNKKQLLCFLLILGVLLIFVGVLNYLRFGSYIEFGYGTHFETFSLNKGWAGLVGLLLSPGKGIILYFPAIIFLPIAIKFSLRENTGLSFLTIYILAVVWLYFGTLEVNGETRFWSGAIAWGPRYMVPVLPLVVILLGGLLKYARNVKTKYFIQIPLILSCIVGFVVNLNGVLVWSEYGTLYAWDKERLGTSALELMTWDSKYSPINLHMKILGEGYVSDIPVESYRNTAWDYALYGLAPCYYDLYILCKFGIVPTVILSGISVLIAVSILKDGRKFNYVYS